jgi:hypothetical protein
VISGTLGDGSLKLRYKSRSTEQIIDFNYDADIDAWSANLQEALNSIPGVETEVQGLLSEQNAVFTITFSGVSGYRNHPLLLLEENNLPNTPAVAISKLVEGAPVNYVAPTLVSSTATPTGSFFTDNTMSLGNLQPGDFVSVWLRRQIDPGTPGLMDDGMTLQITGYPISEQPFKAPTSP